MDVELKEAEVKRGLEQLGIDLPAGWHGLTPATRRAGGRKTKRHPLIQTLFDRAAKQLVEANERITQKTLLRRMESWKPSELKALGVKALRTGDNAIDVTDLSGLRHKLKDVRRYTKRAKKAVGIA